MSEKDGQCNERIWKGFYSHRCSRKDWKDGYCKYHHPDSVKKRREDADARLQAKLAEDSALQDKQRRQSEENAQLRAEVERLRADAERYRWLREESKKRPDFYSGDAEWMVSRAQGGMGHNFFGEKIDAAIDAAMKQAALRREEET